jgi:uncharacterized membrane protein
MPSVNKPIDVDVPVSVAYNQWTQFESFPLFMEGVKAVEQLDDRRLRWTAEFAGRQETWDAEITEQIPDNRVAWTSTSGRRNAGVVTFHHLADSKTRVMLQMDYETEDLVENIGEVLGVIERRIEGDLERFKEFIEGRGAPTGAWRGEIPRSGS